MEKLLKYLGQAMPGLERFIQALKDYSDERPRGARVTVGVVLTMVILYFLARTVSPFSSKTAFFTFLALAGGFSFLCFYVAHRIIVLRIPKGVYYQPIGAKLTRPLRRLPVLEILADRISSDPDIRLWAVSGASGAGKSTLLNELLVPKLQKDGWVIPESVVGFRNEFCFRQQIEQRMAEIKACRLINSDSKALIVLDQFEEFLQSAAFNPDVLSFFKRKLQEMFDLRINCLIGIRKEFYYDLRFLSGHQSLDIFKSTIHVPGIEFVKSEEVDVIDAMASLSNVVGNPALLHALKEELIKQREVLPLEIQMIGFMLEDIKNSSGGGIHQRNMRELGGMRGLIQKYFIRYIGATKDTRTARAVLCALSASGKSRSSFSLNDLALACHRNIDSIGNVMKPLVDGGLVILLPGDTYRLAHDYLSEAFHELSSKLLDPIERDNISYFSEAVGKSNDRKTEPHTITRISTEQLFSPINVLFYFLFIVLINRLLLPLSGLPWWNPLDDIDVHFGSIGTLGGYYLDVHYLPCFIASCIAAWYVWRLHQSFILRMNEYSWLSWTCILLAFVMILAGTFAPHFWLAAASLAGLVIALRIGFSYWFKTNRADALRNVLSRVTNYTLIYMIPALGIGILSGYSFYFYPDLERDIEILYYWEWVITLLFVGFMIVCTKNHTLPHRGALFLSTWNRIRYY